MNWNVNFQREQFLSLHQRCIARYYPLKVRGSDRRTLYGSMLEAEKQLIKHLNFSWVDHERPLNIDVVEENPFAFKPVKSRILIKTD